MLHELLPKTVRERVPLRVKQVYWRLDRKVFVWRHRDMNRGQRFQEIFNVNRWGDTESVSGPGSRLDRTANLRQELPSLLEELEATSLLDAPCGDANWMSLVPLPLDRYYGLDIVPEVVEIARKRKYPKDGCKRSFQVADIVKDDLQRADLVLCRDALIHLPNKDVIEAVANFRRSGAKYLLANLDTRIRRNRDIDAGDTRQLNLSIAPFNLGEPLRVIRSTADVNSRDGLALWKL